ncbi:hypothetical protein E2C01_007886 [Portunus trituberculatus]|uniref:Uncharacterized protein n=1 Tax=Portunus trituberculatus TaxID=210409 RepID=A0A5B7D4Y3_PORTR|nr:hypothetical protein [Portunus trituberculatus]
MTPTISVLRMSGRQARGTLSLQRTTSFLSTSRVEYRPSTTSERERARSVAAYYNQPAVEAAAKKQIR